MEKVENNILERPKKNYFRMNFLISTPKNGVEIVYKDKQTTSDDKNFYIPTDSYTEKRNKRENGIIGTILVNILNYSTEIEEALQQTKLEIETIDIKNIYELATKKYKINELDRKSLIKNFEEVNKIVNKKFFEEDIMLNTFEELQKINNKDMNIMCNFLKELYNNDLDYIEVLFDYIIEALSEEDIEKSVNILFLSIAISKFDVLKLKLFSILFERLNIFDVMIKNFILDLKYICSIIKTESFLYYKSSIIDTYEYENYTNTFYTQLSEYFKKELDKNNINFLPEVCSMFLYSLIDNLEYITLNITLDDLKKKINLLDKIIPTTKEDFDIELPRTYLLHREVKSNFYGEDYKRQNIKPYAYSYNISNLLELYNVTRYHLKLDNREIHICKNCKRYFVTNTRNNEIFCRRKDINYKGKGTRYCYQIGQQQNKSQKIDNIKALHHTLYNRFRNHYKDTEFPKYMEEYKKKKQAYRNKEITKKQYENFFIKYDNNFKKKHPSDRYDRKSKNKNK